MPTNAAGGSSDAPADTAGLPRIPPRWFVRTAWLVHRASYRQAAPNDYARLRPTERAAAVFESGDAS